MENKNGTVNENVSEQDIDRIATSVMAALER
jgi:hypothetical protein